MKYNVSKFHFSKVLLEPCVFTVFLSGFLGDLLISDQKSMFSCASFQDYIPVNWETGKHVKTQGFGITPTQNPVFLQPFLVAGFQNPVFLQSFWPDSALP